MSGENPQVVIDDQFRDLICPLQDHEEKLLEESLLKDGCRDKLTVWSEGNVLLDGHHRYRLCKKHNIKYETRIIQLPHRYAAEDWIYVNQLSRRNLPPETISYLRGQRWNLIEKIQGIRTDLIPSKEEDVDPKTKPNTNENNELNFRQNLPEVNSNENKELGQENGNINENNNLNQEKPDANNPEESLENFSAQYGVSPRTIRIDAQFAEAIETLREIDPNLKHKIDRQESKAKKGAIILAANLFLNEKIEKPRRIRLVKRILSGEINETKAKKKIAEILEEINKKEESKLIPPLPSSNKLILTGDFKIVGNEIPDSSVSLIFTDPPYNEEWIPQYKDLAQFAARVLKPGGSLITYAGAYALPQIFPLMIPHINYLWIIACIHSGPSAIYWPANVAVKWKPLLWFVKGKREDKNQVIDIVLSEYEKKEHHEWEQSLVEANYYIENLTQKGEYVVDPLCGSGTTGVAALQLGRKFTGIELDELEAKKIYERLSKY